MIRYAICNETFEGWEWERICKLCASLGYEGLEVAPFTLASRIGEVDPIKSERLVKTEADFK